MLDEPFVARACRRARMIQAVFYPAAGQDDEADASLGRFTRRRHPVSLRLRPRAGQQFTGETRRPTALPRCVHKCRVIQGVEPTNTSHTRLSGVSDLDLGAAERFGGAWRTPPVRARKLRTWCMGTPRTRAMALKDSPSLHRRHILSCWTAENPWSRTCTSTTT